MITYILIGVFFMFCVEYIINSGTFKKTLKLKIGNGLDKDTNLGPITTQKRLEEIENLAVLQH